MITHLPDRHHGGGGGACRLALELTCLGRLQCLLGTGHLVINRTTLEILCLSVQKLQGQERGAVLQISAMCTHLATCHWDSLHLTSPPTSTHPLSSSPGGGYTHLRIFLFHGLALTGVSGGGTEEQLAAFVCLLHKHTHLPSYHIQKLLFTFLPKHIIP